MKLFSGTTVWNIMAELKKASLTACLGTRSGTRTHTRLTPHRILSPVRLPIPPSEQE